MERGQTRMESQILKRFNVSSALNRRVSSVIPPCSSVAAFFVGLSMKILVTGASGQLGAYLLAGLAGSRHEVVAWSGRERARRGGFDLDPVDLLDLDALESALESARPDAVIHAAALSSAEAVQLNPERAEAINVRATRRIGEWVESNRSRLVFTSTDLVFGGTRALNREDDPAEPVLAYGRSKRAAELTLESFRSAVVARLPLLYGLSLCGRPSFFSRAVDSLRQGDPQAFFEDEFRTPLDYRSAARGLIRLVTNDVSGIIHLAGPERLSRFALMTRAAGALGLDPGLIRANRQADANLSEPRPADVSLDTTRWQSLFPDQEWPSVEEAIRGIMA